MHDIYRKTYQRFCMKWCILYILHQVQVGFYFQLFLAVPGTAVVRASLLHTVETHQSYIPSSEQPTGLEL